MNPAAGEAVRRSPNWLWAAAAALGLTLVVRQIVTSGSWLDEYWQLWISGAPADALFARLAADTHPPWFNLLARPILHLTSGAIVPARLINLAAATAVLAVGLWRIRGLEAALRWRIFLLIVASGGAVGMTDLAASFRSYPWLLVLAGLQGTLLVALVFRRPVPIVLAVLVTVASIAIHYVHAAAAIAIALVSLAVAWRVDRAAFRALLLGLVVGTALDLTTALVQMPHWRVDYDVNWIAQSGGGGAPATLTAVGVNFLTCNLVGAALLAVGLIARRRRTMLTVLAPIPIAFAAWLAMEASAPHMVPRHMAGVTALMATAAAVAWWELALVPAVDGVIALLVALQPLASSLIRPPLPGWEAGARISAAQSRDCPQARLYAVSAWRFRDYAESRAARFEEPVIGLAYRIVGRAFGLNPRFVTGPTTVEFGRCPAIVWIEAAHGIEQAPPESILRHARLRLPAPAKVRVVPTPNGAVLLISPADRLQPHP